MSNRETQFAYFAALLMQEIDEHIGAVTEWALKHDINDEKPIGRELASRWKKTIASRAYDLVQHTVGHSLEYLHECGHELSGGMNTRIAASIPDMTAWPEETNT